MNEMIRLYYNYNNFAKALYFFIVLIGYTTVFIGLFGFSANYLWYPSMLVTGSLFAWLFQIKYNYFNNLFLSVVYRIVLLSVVFYLLYQLSFLHYDKKNLCIFTPETDPAKFIFCGTLLTAIFTPFIGCVLALPFKFFSLLCDDIDSIDNLYTDKDRIPLEPDNVYGNSGSVYDKINIYSSYNEQQLEAALRNALRDEDYKIVAIIKEHLKKFGGE